MTEEEGVAVLTRMRRLPAWASYSSRPTLALRAAIAAALAWAAVQPLWGIADDYPYYAPLGAVIAVSSTIVGSIRESVQGVAAILVGAILATCVGLTPLPRLWAIAVVVLAGTMLGGLPWLRTMASWVPISAMFVLVLGGGDPVEFSMAYFGLTALGATIGIAVDLVLPALPVQATESTLGRLRRLLADQVDALAAGLNDHEAPSPDGWQERTYTIDPLSRQLNEMVGHLHEAKRGNWRARRWQQRIAEQYQASVALMHLSRLVQDLRLLMTRHEHSDLERQALGATLRPYAVMVLTDLSSVLRATNDGSPEELHDRLDSAEQALTRFANAIREQEGQGYDLFVASNIVVTMERIIASLHQGSPTRSETIV